LHMRVSLEGLEVVELEHVGAGRWNANSLSGLPFLILGGGNGRESRLSCDADKDGQPNPANDDHASSPKCLVRPPLCGCDPAQSAMLFIFIAAIGEFKLRRPQSVWCLLAVRPGSPQA